MAKHIRKNYKNVSQQSNKSQGIVVNPNAQKEKYNNSSLDSMKKQLSLSKSKNYNILYILIAIIIILIIGYLIYKKKK
jgi:hypothetical protein